MFQDDTLACVATLPKELKLLILSYMGTGGKLIGHTKRKRIKECVLTPKKATWTIGEGWIWLKKEKKWEKKNKWGCTKVSNDWPFSITFSSNTHCFFISVDDLHFPDWNKTTFLYEKRKELKWLDLKTEKEFVVSSLVSQDLQWGLLEKAALVLDRKNKRATFVTLNCHANKLFSQPEPLLEGCTEMELFPCKTGVKANNRIISYSK